MDTGTIWRGAERERLRPLLERCEALVAGLEWNVAIPGSNEEYFHEGYELGCPVCEQWSQPTHGTDCALAALLADLRKELGK